MRIRDKKTPSVPNACVQRVALALALSKSKNAAAEAERDATRNKNHRNFGAGRFRSLRVLFKFSWIEKCKVTF